MVNNTEKQLLELVNSPTTPYYYFPTQRLSKANSLIQELVQGYGFIGDWVDQKIGKGTVIARRQPGIKAAVPTKLLSQVAKDYNPNDTVKDPFILPSPDILLKSSTWSQNGFYISGIPSDVATINFETLIGTLMTGVYPNSKLFWLNDESCFVVWDRNQVIDVVADDLNSKLTVNDTLVAECDTTDESTSKTVPTVESNGALNANQEESKEDDEKEKQEITKEEEILLHLQELGWATSVIPISVSPLGALTTKEGQVVGHAKKRNVSELRGHFESGWTEVANWKMYLLPLSKVE